MKETNQLTAVASEPVAVQPAKMGGASDYIIEWYSSHTYFLDKNNIEIPLVKLFCFFHITIFASNYSTNAHFL